MNRRALGVLGALALGGGLLTACSSGSSTSTTGHATRPTGSATTAAKPPTTSAGTPSSTTSSGPARCATASLTGGVTGSTGAAGTIETTVGLKSDSASACVLEGYPGLQLLGPGGSVLPTNVQRGGRYSFTTMAPTTVTLTAGQSAYFNIGSSDVPVGGETSCPTSTTLEVTPPDATDHLVITVALTACGQGTLVVSPVFAGTGPDSQSTAPPTG